MPLFRSHVSLRNTQATPLPDEFAGDDVRLAPALIEHVLARFSVPGDRLLDPFAGFGTVLSVAQRLGRDAWGIEIDPRRAEYARAQLASPERLLCADARALALPDTPVFAALPAFDLALTSPPYACRGDIDDPLTGYAAPGRGYDAYLADLVAIFQAVAARLKPDGRLIIEVSNLKRDGAVTTLAWDLGLRLARVLTFAGEIIVAWDTYGYGYEHSYCLVFAVHTRENPGA